MPQQISELPVKSSDLFYFHKQNKVLSLTGKRTFFILVILFQKVHISFLAEWFNVTGRMPRVLTGFTFVILGKSPSLRVFCFFLCKRERIGQGDCHGFLLRSFDSVSEELTHLKDLGEGDHLCRSEAKNTSRF